MASARRTREIAYPNPIIQRLYSQKIDKHTFLVDGTGEVQRVEANINPHEGNLLYRLVTDEKDPMYRTLEVGCAGGTSALYLTQGVLDRYSKRDDSELKGTPPADPRDFTELDPASFPSSGKTHTIGSKSLALKVSSPDEATVRRAEDLRAKGAIHVAIDPYQMGPHTGVAENEKGWQGLGVFNVHQAGTLPMVRLVQKKSHVALPQALETYGEGSFDLIFVDGMHLYDYTLVDVFYGAMLLREGGLLVVDDIQHPSVKEVAWYLDDNYTNFKRIETKGVHTMGVWRKLRDDDRKWSFHCSVCKVPGRIEKGMRTYTRKNSTARDRDRDERPGRKQGRQQGRTQGRTQRRKQGGKNQ